MAKQAQDALLHDQRRARRPDSDRPLRRSRDERVLGGVCGGIAEFVGAAPRTVRVVYALSALPSLGFTAVGYLLLWLLIPAARSDPATGPLAPSGSGRLAGRS